MTLAIDNELDYLGGDVVTQPFVIDGGELAVPTAPGLGVDVDLELRRALSRSRHHAARISIPAAPAGFR